jgi:hypothetical protein
MKAKINEELVTSFLQGNVFIKNTSPALIERLFNHLLINIEDYGYDKNFYVISGGVVVILKKPSKTDNVVSIEYFFNEEVEIDITKDSEYLTITASNGSKTVSVDLTIMYKKCSFIISSGCEEGVSFDKDSVDVALLKVKAVEAAVNYVKDLEDKGLF